MRLPRVIDEALKRKIDTWIRDQDRNEYGDEKGTFYMGGTPLFDERTGRRKDLYEYILERNPELLD
jgi:hypothetical protein